MTLNEYIQVLQRFAKENEAGDMPVAMLAGEDPSDVEAADDCIGIRKDSWNPSNPFDPQAPYVLLNDPDVAYVRFIARKLKESGEQ